MQRRRDRLCVLHVDRAGGRFSLLSFRPTYGPEAVVQRGVALAAQMTQRNRRARVGRCRRNTLSAMNLIHLFNRRFFLLPLLQPSRADLCAACPHFERIFPLDDF
jgi:hypothetical protein